MKANGLLEKLNRALSEDIHSRELSEAEWQMVYDTASEMINDPENPIEDAKLIFREICKRCHNDMDIVRIYEEMQTWGPAWDLVSTGDFELVAPDNIYEIIMPYKEINGVWTSVDRLSTGCCKRHVGFVNLERTRVGVAKGGSAGFYRIMFKSQADAQAFADRMNANPLMAKGRVRGDGGVPWTYVVQHIPARWDSNILVEKYHDATYGDCYKFIGAPSRAYLSVRQRYGYNVAQGHSMGDNRFNRGGRQD